MAFSLIIVEALNKKKKNQSVLLVVKWGNWCVMHVVINSLVIIAIQAITTLNVKKNSITILLTCNNWLKKNRILQREVEKKEKLWKNATDVLKISKKENIANHVDLFFAKSAQILYTQLENLRIIKDLKLFLSPKVIKK